MAGKHSTTNSDLQSAPVPPKRDFHIFGNGISFSISPTIHNAGFQHDGLPFHYDIRESASINEIAPLIQSPSFGGASVTMPHKLHVHKFCDDLTASAKAIGAVNTLVVRYDEGGDGQKGRRITGDNTDWSGLYSIMQRYKETSKQTLLSGLVIGAGGASRAALFAMHHAGVKTIYLVNRTRATAEDIRESFKDMFPVTVLASLQDLPAEKPTVVIGTVPAEMTTESQFADLFGASGLCIDMSYKPRQTPLLTVAQKHAGWETVTGVQVLLAQAFDQYRLWTLREPPTKVMVNAVIQHEASLGQPVTEILV